MPISVSKLISGVWQRQCRWMEVQGNVHSVPCTVSTSMPQGDGWSVIGMNAVLAGPLTDLKARFPAARQSTFMDDRSWSTSTAELTVQVGAAWRAWSATLGLQENRRKEQFSHRTGAGRRALIAEGVDAAMVKVSPLILGCHLQPARRVQLQQRERDRLDTTSARLRRIALLPLPALARRPFVAGVLSGALWGWVARRPPKADMGRVAAAVHRALRMPKQASPFLFELLAGHSMSVTYRTVEAQLTAAARRVAKRQAEPGDWDGGGWSAVLRHWMQEWGWIEAAGGWRWHHPTTQGVLRLRPGEMDPMDKFKHELRESWRATAYGSWQRQARNDSFQCRDVVYDSRRLKAAAAALRADPALLPVLTGATMSPAAWQSSRQEDLRCPGCGQHGAGDLMHLLWHCPASAGGRPQAAPADRLQARLGWPPVPDAAGAALDILTWHKEVRRCILVHRWEGTGARPPDRH
jgi:hypothetical protein